MMSLNKRVAQKIEMEKNLMKYLTYFFRAEITGKMIRF